MNQILDYSPNKSTGGGSSKSDKIVRVFAVLLAVFAICLFGVAGYSILNNKGEEDPSKIAQSVKKPEITADAVGTNVVITVEHDKALEKIVYNWDSGKEYTVSCENQTEFTTEISLLAGNHYLTVQAIDVDGVEGTCEKSFNSEIGEDKEPPVIEGGDRDNITGNKINFTVTDETEMSYVTYRWNDEEEVTVEADPMNPKVISFEVEIPKGKNDLIVTAVDKSNNTSSFPQAYTGITNPDITLTVSAEKDEVSVRVFHENGIQEILLEVNGQSQKVQLPEDNPTPTDVTFNFPISGARNVIKVAAKSVDATSGEIEEEIINDDLLSDNIEISLTQSETDKHVGNVKIVSPDGMQELNLIINDVDVPVDLSQYNPKDVQNIDFPIPLVDGINKVVFKIVKPDGSVKEDTIEIYCE